MNYNKAVEIVRDKFKDKYDFKFHTYTGICFSPIEQQGYLEYTSDITNKEEYVPLNKKDNEWFIEHIAKKIN